MVTGRMAERARDVIRQICEAREVVIMRGAISPDHIHMLVTAPPILAPANLAQYIKGRSSRMLQAEFPELRKRYWGQHMWARAISARRWARWTRRRSRPILKTKSGTKTKRGSRSQRPPSLEPALSRSSLQTASAVIATFSRQGFYRLSAGSLKRCDEAR